jgi:hypothetical protein
MGTVRSWERGQFPKPTRLRQVPQIHIYPVAQKSSSRLPYLGEKGRIVFL